MGGISPHTLFLNSVTVSHSTSLTEFPYPTAGGKQDDEACAVKQSEGAWHLPGPFPFSENQVLDIENATSNEAFQVLMKTASAQQNWSQITTTAQKKFQRKAEMQRE